MLALASMQLHFNPFENESVVQIPRNLAWQAIPVSRSRGEYYVKLLRQNCPEEFKMDEFQEGLTKEQFQQIVELRKLFLRITRGGRGYKEKRIIKILKTQGI